MSAHDFMTPDVLDDAVPPPAYEVSQLDFDRKVSLALQQSLTISQPPSGASNYTDDVFEVWDDAIFEANARAYTLTSGIPSGSSGSGPRPPTSTFPAEKPTKSLASPQHVTRQLPSPGPPLSNRVNVSPLQIAKKSTVTPGPPAPTHAHNGPQPGTSSLSSSDPPFLPTNRAPTSHPIHFVADENNDHDEALPAFTPIGPSLEGPAYEEVEGRPPIPPSQRYTGQSPPPSPLVGPVCRPSATSPPPQEHRLPVASSTQSLPVEPRPNPSHPVPRPYASAPIVPAARIPKRPPTMQFDPSVAYAKHSAPAIPQKSREPIPLAPGNAAAFYSPAISSIISRESAAKPTKPAAPVIATSTSYAGQSYAYTNPIGGPSTALQSAHPHAVPQHRVAHRSGSAPMQHAHYQPPAPRHSHTLPPGAMPPTQSHVPHRHTTLSPPQHDQRY